MVEELTLSRADGPGHVAGWREELTLFGFGEHPLLDQIRAADLNQFTPLQALQLVQQWQEQLRKEK